MFVHWGPYRCPRGRNPPAHSAPCPTTSGSRTTPTPSGTRTRSASRARPRLTPRARVRRRAVRRVPRRVAGRGDRPGDWARLFRAMGADYVVPTTKHHDGVALWDAPGWGDRTTVAPRAAARPHRAARRSGARRGPAVRRVLLRGAGLGGDRPPAAPVERRRREVPAEGRRVQRLRVRPCRRPRRPLSPRPDLERHRLARCREDAGTGTRSSLLAHYRSVVPEGIVNDRWGVDVGDYRTSEYDADTQHETATGWEHCRGLGFSFGYNRVEDARSPSRPRRARAPLRRRRVARRPSAAQRGAERVRATSPTCSGARSRASRHGWQGQAADPRTASCSIACRGEVQTDASWWRAWATPDGVVAVVDDPSARVVAAPGVSLEVVVLPD